MTTRSTFFRALTVPERGAAGGFACDIEKNSTLMDGSGAETLPFVLIGENRLYVSTEQLPERTEK